MSNENYYPLAKIGKKINNSKNNLIINMTTIFKPKPGTVLNIENPTKPAFTTPVKQKRSNSLIVQPRPCKLKK